MKQKRTGRSVLSIILLLSGILVTVSLLVDRHSDEKQLVKDLQIYHVENERKTVTKYAKKYGVEEYVDVLLAMMLQESGGRGKDPMQSSESYCGEIGCIKSRTESIEQGVQYFSHALERANGELELAVQSYNFGLGFIAYVKEHETDYNLDIAIQFSKEMYEKLDDTNHYSCLRKEAAKFDACYGDIYYVRDVLEQKKNFQK